MENSVLGPWSVPRSKMSMGQRAWLQHRCCAPMGCECPIFRGPGWAEARPECTGTMPKRENESTRYTWGYLILWLRKPIYYKRLYIAMDKQ